MKRIVSILALLLCFLSFPVKADDNVIEIYTAHDLVKLAEECHYDGYSKGLRVELMADISLYDYKNFSLMVFDGVFDGNGHTVSNLIVDEKLSPYGFIGHLMENGRIENLCIEGVIIPEGDGNEIGVFAGINDGVISDSSFKGTLRGNDNVGIAAGVNNGVISNFLAQGIVKADNTAGGIAGRNSGIIRESISYVSLNTSYSDSTPNISEIEFNSIDDLRQVSSFEDAGGIAGVNSGEIISCINYGPVGYPHVGYNVGGIVGRNSGCILECENYGPVDGRKDAGGIVGHMEPDIINDISASTVGRLRSQMNQLNYLINRASDNFEEGTDNIGTVLDEMSDETLRAIDALKEIDIEVSKPEDGDLRDIEINADLSALDNSLRRLVDKSRDLSGSVGDTAGNMSDDVKEISNKVNQLGNTAMELINYEPESIYTDVSAINTENIKYGRVKDCVNNATVSGDMNIGGIAGVIGIENSDPESDELFSFDIDKSNSYELRAIADGCINTGRVKAKRSNAGGIIGNQLMGYVYNNSNSGEVSSENGNYVGGITGRSSSLLSDNLARCYLSGNKYLGGISGYIDEDGSLINNYSMVNIGDYEQYIGAIVGLSEGELKGNYYYSLDLYGENGVSYSGKCSPLDYSEIIEADEFFDRLYLSFEYNDEIVKCIELEYGDSLDKSVYPVIINDEDVRAVFEDADLNNIRQDIRIKGEDEEYVKSLSYSLRSDGEVLFYCDGQFSKGDRIRLAVIKSDNENFINGYHIELPDDGNAMHNLRFKFDDDVIIRVDDKEVDYERIGSFLSFNVEGLSHDIMVYEKSVNYMPYLVVAVVVSGVLVSGLIRHHYKKERPDA